MKRKAHPHEHQGELNIIPFLDIMVNLVMFMLMSMSGFVTFQMINTVAPDLAADVAPPSDPSTPPPKPEDNLVLNVSISKRGFYIAATGGVLPGDSAAAPGADPSAAPPTIPLIKKMKKFKRNGVDVTEEVDDYDYDALTAKLNAIKAVYPTKTQVFIAAEPAIKYEVVIGTMDASRLRPDGSSMFPDVAFSAFN
jgi:biopolymer transport protein ExbD